MRSQLEIIQQIESYLLGDMQPTAKAQFESAMEASSELQKQVQFQRLQIHASRRDALRLQIDTLCPPRKTFWQKFKSLFTGITLVVAIIAAFSAFKVYEMVSENKDTSIETTPIVTEASSEHYSQTPGKGNGVYQNHNFISHIAVSNEHPTWFPMKQQHFYFNAEDGGVFEGDEGVLVVVPKNALLNEHGEEVNGPVEFKLIEVLQLEDIVAYNLSTMNGKNPLSSGGMVRVIFEQDGEELTINPGRPLSIEIPTNDYNPDMQVWEGVVENEKVDWQNPQELNKTLTTIDLDLLDLLPDGFEGAVASLLPYHGHTVLSKKLVDSLYYSLTKIETQKRLETPEIYERQTSDKFAYGYARSFYNSLDPDKIAPLQKVPITAYENGKLYCKLFTNGEGAFEIDLRGENKRVLKLVAKIEGQRINPVVYTFERNKKTPILFEARKKVEKVEDVTPLYKKNGPDEVNAPETFCFVEPLSIKSILEDAFQNTFIATKEFEERMKVIHTLENGDEILAIYVNNLSLDLWKCDQRAANKLRGEDRDAFREFEKQKLTNVDNDGINQAELTAYYNEKRKEYARAQREEREMLADLNDNELNALQSKLVDKLNSPEKTISNAPKRTKNKKWDVLNKNDVSRNGSYKVSWFSGSWINIDCYLAETNSSTKSIEISVDTRPEGLTVYQCIASLKTLVTLTRIGGNYRAKFPERDAEETYCLAISKEDDGFQYAEEVYTPETKDAIQLTLSTISPEELKRKLMLLSPLNNQIIDEMSRESSRLRKEQEVRSKAKEVYSEIDGIIEHKEIERKFREFLKKSINACGEGVDLAL